MSKPKVIVLCGSSRFVDVMAVCAWILEKEEGAIAMGLHLLPTWYRSPSNELPEHHLAEHEVVAEAMDELHMRKIDLADEVFVVNCKNYIGESTSNEIRYATERGLNIRYYTDDYVGDYVANIIHTYILTVDEREAKALEKVASGIMTRAEAEAKYLNSDKYLEALKANEDAGYISPKQAQEERIRIIKAKDAAAAKMDCFYHNVDLDILLQALEMSEAAGFISPERAQEERAKIIKAIEAKGYTQALKSATNFVSFVKARCMLLKEIGNCSGCPKGVNHHLSCHRLRQAEKDYYEQGKR